MFSLPFLPRPALQLNDPQAQDSQIEAAVAQVVDGLFCMLATLGVVPLIRCPRGGAAEHVAAQVGQLPSCRQSQSTWCRQGTAAGRAFPQLLPSLSSTSTLRWGALFVTPPGVQLDAKLRDALAGRSSLFTEGGAGGAGLAASLQRPLLCLFDRNFELSVVLQHAWTYKPLVRAAVGCGGGGAARAGAGPGYRA